MARYAELTGAQIVGAIRRKNRRSVFFGILGMLLVVLFLLGVGYMMTNGHPIYGVVGVLLCAFFLWALGTSVIKSMRILKDVENSRVFRKYGAPEALAERIAEGSLSPILDSKRALIADSFIMIHKDYESYVPFNQVMLLYRKEHRTNGVLDGIFLVVHDVYGDKFEYPFKLGKKHAGDMSVVADEILRQAPECRFGYTQENLAYVQQNCKKI